MIHFLNLNFDSISKQFNKSGYIVIPKLFDLDRISELRTICDRILCQWIQKSAKRRRANKKNLGGLTELHYFIEHPEQLNFLLNTVAHERVLSVLECICNTQLLFHDAQYFFNPVSNSWLGDWHRDGQIIAPDESTEKSRIFNSSSIRVHIALLPDENLEFVFGSHTRWDTPIELAIRKGLNGKKTHSSEMPSAIKIHLDPGDAVFFSSWGIHRGNYLANKPRKTLAMLYSSPVGWYTPPPTCFLDSNVLDGLSPQKKAFFRRFVNAYQNRWLEAK
jgi:ectoine hydroxylase-related dioxygenase (phytanoyl-CoA dioxygenase family)